MIFKNTEKQAFTIFELSIVLLIIGGIVASITSVQSILERSELNKQIVQVEDLLFSYNNFILTYQKPPGDFDKAYQFFGDILSCENGAIITDGCNGNGNNIIDDYEGRMAPYHLYAEGLMKYSIDALNVINGKTAPPGSPTFDIDDAIAVTSIIGGNFGLRGNLSFSPVESTTLYDDYFVGNYLYFTTYRNDYYASITPKQAKFIDEKMDDGKATTGIVLTSIGQDHAPFDGTLCLDSAPTLGSNSDWLLTDISNSCYVGVSLVSG